MSAFGSFFVYENWTNTFAKVHRGDCPYCNEGHGFQGRGDSTPSGRWHGPFDTSAEAMPAAAPAPAGHADRQVWSVGSCGHRGDDLRISVDAASKPAVGQRVGRRCPDCGLQKAATQFEPGGDLCVDCR